ncbi:MAG: HK97 family phage prohead protease [Clostridium sp.]
MKNRTIRSLCHDFNVRSDENGDKFISGYFAVFNSNYEIFDGMTESIDPSAFDSTLNDDIRCLIDHDTRLVLGRNKANTLTLRVDAKGLWGEVKINQNDQDAMNLYERVKRKDVDQCSFGFDILDEERSVNETTGDVHWLIKSVKLYEVSIVTFPAYEETGVSARKKEVDTLNKRSFEIWKDGLMKKLKGEK